MDFGFCDSASTVYIPSVEDEVVHKCYEDPSELIDKIEGYSDRNKISKLLEKIPVLNDFFTLHKKIGEGTFSSVYLASLNSNTDKEEEEECRFAIKHLIPTCSPARIIQEITCLKNIGGTDNVVGLTQCIRKKDNCVFIMPFLPHRKFSDYFLDMDVAEIKLYMRNLLIALRRVHKFKVIHRDVKPANFLYDRETKQFLLVDFGLAENVEKKRDSSDDNVQSSVTENTPVVSKKRKHSHLADDIVFVCVHTSSADDADDTRKHATVK